MTTAAIYARFSSARQNETSIDDQIRVCKEYCARKGYSVVKVYSDAAMTGTNDDRPGFQLMLSECGAWDVLVVYKTDRFARNRFDALKNKRVLKDNGARLESATEEFGDGPESIIIEGLFDAMNEYYSANLSQNVKRGMHGRALECKAMGRPVFGYCIDPETRQYAIVESEAAVIRKLFELRATQRYFNFEEEFKDVRTRTGKPLSYSTASKWIANDKYKGTYRWGGVVVEGGMPAIVDPETWEKAQEHHRTRFDGDDPYLLSGKLFGEFGDPNSVDSTTNRHGTKYMYYVVDGKRIGKHKLEDAVAESVSANIDENVIEEVIRAVMEIEDENASQTRSDALKGVLEDLQKQESNLVDMAARMGHSDAIEKRLREVSDAIADTKLELASVKEPIRLDENAIRFCMEEFQRPENQKNLLDCFCERVVLHGDGTLDCVFTWGGSEQLDDPFGQESNEPAGQPTGSNEVTWWALRNNVRICLYGIAIRTRIAA